MNDSNVHSSRGYSIPTRARPVGTLPSFHARCAMAARCPWSATASRIPSKPSSALPATRMACNRVRAVASEDAKCLTQHPYFLLPEPQKEPQLWQRNETQQHSFSMAIVVKTIFNKNM